MFGETMLVRDDVDKTVRFINAESHFSSRANPSRVVVRISHPRLSKAVPHPKRAVYVK